MENLTMILGGEDLQVTKRDGSQETVRVRELKISELPKYSMVIDDEAKTAELLCGKEAGWADSLTRESLVAVIEKGDGLNMDFMARWTERRLNRTRKMMPDFDTKLMAMAKESISTSLASA